MSRPRMKLFGAIAGVVLIVLWWGVPTFNKWRADRLVDELCAKDGGVRVYETVTLLADRFNNLGQPQVPDKKYAKTTDEYFSTWLTTDIRGNSNTTDYNALVVIRNEHNYFRSTDEKLLGRLVTYGRRGGDPIGPWHPSHYSCPDETNPLGKIFKKSTGAKS